jgi:NhaB family Na+:H+ antiporter
VLTCLLVEKYRFGYGEPLPPAGARCCRSLTIAAASSAAVRTLRLIAQGIIGVWLIAALAFHLAEVGLIGLSVIILATTFTGVTMSTPLAKRLPKRCRLPRCWRCSLPLWR